DAPVHNGRWTRVARLAPASIAPTQRAVARTRLLLDRYGIVSRPCLTGEQMSGGFGPMYKVLRELEEQGRVRRGYFVEGLAGAQFAYAGAIDRLRSGRSAVEERDHLVSADDTQLLAALDPANPYGAIAPWPDTGEQEPRTPRRAAGCWVLLTRGRPALYLSGGGRKLLTFPATLRDEEGALAAALEALRSLPKGAYRGSLTIETIDGEAARESALLDQFLAAGFSRDYKGLMDVRPDNLRAIPGRRSASKGSA
ncbi:MAG: DEAD/DEAH box helicase, partial [Xanthomonadales bacterium]|nr:DEAD/DEAH box helicase [Xanthomonadales bacterium]